MLNSKRRVVRVILTHDVDYPPQGPGLNHILARRNRFSEEIISRVISEGYNPYLGIPDLINFEEDYGLKSTLFFRSRYYGKSEYKMHTFI